MSVTSHTHGAQLCTDPGTLPAQCLLVTKFPVYPCRMHEPILSSTNEASCYGRAVVLSLPYAAFEADCNQQPRPVLSSRWRVKPTMAQLRRRRQHLTRPQ